MENKKIIIYTDGGARGNPGPAAYGIAVYNSEGKIIKRIGKFLGERTNNEAEYEGVIAALEEAAKLAARYADFYLDSELVVRQLNNIYRVKNQRMQGFILRVRNLETKFKKITYTHVPREKNKLADKLVNEAIDKAGK
ncbi:MAG: ribonuclease HI family protein [Candidatus Doudnabacteria bacterium]|nr:ribonuclease HI family protein [Candidatus Doudnabacteria bacterium]